MGALGAIEIFTLDLDDSVQRISAALRRLPHADRLAGFVDLISDRYPREIVRVLKFVIDAGSRPINPTELAQVFGSSRRSLERGLRRRNLPSPEKLIVWGRLLNAARLLEDQGRSAERIAFAVGFPSASALSVACRRYIGAPLSQMRSSSSLQHAMDRFLSESRDVEEDGAAGA